ncbi:STAS domain-containing protein [Cellulomonas palmilytica]|uniref:STAS domain-containing protein n=1 Tax=Cellulomonas palmilytica TaxID=2608402 RepID=UPI001F258B5D|nr:STAS domain-containing protein [Cellulomonas palmilytica]UJP39621.1 STAS domain-containing protein [Cellulomonas palmilytica]
MSVRPRPPGRIDLEPGVPAILRVSGDVDFSTVDRFCIRHGVDQAGVGRMLAGRGVREIDLSEATFIDSAVLGLVVGIAPYLRPERLRLRGASGAPLAVLEIAGVDRLVDLG